MEVERIARSIFQEAISARPYVGGEGEKIKQEPISE
jgi:hypothetical protein